MMREHRRKGFVMGFARVVNVPLVCGLLLISPSGIYGAEGEKQAGPSGLEVLTRVAATYAHCKSYHDEGVVKIVYTGSGRKRVEERPFRTAFVRPDRFRFEYADTDPQGTKRRHIVWRKGADVRTWWDAEPGLRDEGSLGAALAGATGVSGGSAHTVPALLMPEEVGGRQLTDMTDLKRIGDAQHEDADCYRLEGMYGDLQRTVWVERRTLLVRRIDSQKTFATFHAEETTTYRPTINQEVTANLLELDLPGQ
jgi:hypothetical protein